MYQTGFRGLAAAPALAEGRVPSIALPGVRGHQRRCPFPAPPPLLLTPCQPCSGDSCLLAEGGRVASVKKIKGTSSRVIRGGELRH